MPRFSDGVPVTLGTVLSINTTNGPLIAPYPDYSWHESQGANCDGLTSIFRIFVRFFMSLPLITRTAPKRFRNFSNDSKFILTELLW